MFFDFCQAGEGWQVLERADGRSMELHHLICGRNLARDDQARTIVLVIQIRNKRIQDKHTVEIEELVCGRKRKDLIIS